MYIFVGLGNPGEEYENTRHNIGRMALSHFLEKNKGEEWKEDKKNAALSATVSVGKQKVTLILPETFMNKSGQSVKSLITSVKKAEKLVVVHDDLDLPFGRFKISFNKSSGGHRGVESIIKAVKTEGFIRVRIGISPANAKGIVKKPKGEEEVGKFILGKFKPAEMVELKKVFKRVSEALEMLLVDGREKATGFANSL